MTGARSDLLTGWPFALLLFSGVLPVTADEPKAVETKSQAVLNKLEQKIDFGFEERTPLWDVVNYTRVASQGPNDNGFSFDFDDAGLKRAGKDRHSPIPVALKGEGIPIKDGLQKVLEPMGLTYSVNDGVLTVKTKPAKDSK
jgi:hypothetical protein